MMKGGNVLNIVLETKEEEIGITAKAEASLVIVRVNLHDQIEEIAE